MHYTHTCVTARKANAVHGGVLCQEVPNFTALAGDEVDQPRRQTRLVE